MSHIFSFIDHGELKSHFEFRKSSGSLLFPGLLTFKLLIKLPKFGVGFRRKKLISLFSFDCVTKLMN